MSAEQGMNQSNEISAEQQARDMLERMGVENAQSMTAGDLVELANLIAGVESKSKTLPSLLDRYEEARQAIFDYFGYTENWVVIPIQDSRDFYWKLNGTGPGEVRFSETLISLNDEYAGDYYEHAIYTQRFLEKWVYRGEDYTMICVDTFTDGNKFLQIFDNAKEVPWED